MTIEETLREESRLTPRKQMVLARLAKATDFFGVFQIFQERQQLLPEAVIKDHGPPYFPGTFSRLL